MAVITHMRLKHPEIRGVGLASSKSYAEGDTKNNTTNSGSNPKSTLGNSNPTPVPEITTANGDLNYSVPPTHLGHKPQESLKIQQQERNDPSQISELYPDISITVGEALMETSQRSNWSVELTSGGSDVQLPRVVKDMSRVEEESTKVDLKLKLQSYQNISFKLTGSHSGADDSELENNNDKPEQDPADKYPGISIEKTGTRHSKSETSDKFDDNDPLANCLGDEDCDVKRRLKSYPNISFEVTVSPNKKSLKRSFEPEVIMYDETDFAMDQENEARRFLTPTRLVFDGSKENCDFSWTVNFELKWS